MRKKKNKNEEGRREKNMKELGGRGMKAKNDKQGNAKKNKVSGRENNSNDETGRE